MFPPNLRRPIAWGLCALALLTSSACARRIEPAIVQPLDFSAALATADRLDALLPADVLLLGEQHDAPEHQQIHQAVITALATRGQLAAVAIEMADAGATTARLQPSATEIATRAALRWDEEAWPWKAYGPAVMAAVRAGVPVLGANLPRNEMRASMADSGLDGQLPGPALKAQQQLIRSGHCNLLPESQITPMTRVQIARDISMANALKQAILPGKTVLLLAGSVHADPNLGVPRHLPPELSRTSVRLRAGAAAEGERTGAFDAEWSTPALAPKDYCAGLRR